jgi:hypothetical protein
LGSKCQGISEPFSRAQKNRELFACTSDVGIGIPNGSTIMSDVAIVAVVHAVYRRFGHIGPGGRIYTTTLLFIK